MIWLGLVLFVRGMGIGGLQMPMMTDIFIGLDKQDIPGASESFKTLVHLLVQPSSRQL
ncbi:Drug resistance transporter EmrB/QacA subfamily [Lactococcus lactis subsp. lactis]|uniref:Drug resistance transporter EmrB/QacA subfamily n=1 Tax=Lactococcus lactis subsp. lactis TaxID=1360 RepID=A0A0V8DDC8_LACLL|nr:hypothetical protein [Lactococcus lactis]KSU11486.1 Drug resistance transporter EmrB/QacA subfamily [Lactococcus lactis subsp. lactis]